MLKYKLLSLSVTSFSMPLVIILFVMHWLLNALTHTRSETIFGNGALKLIDWRERKIDWYAVMCIVEMKKAQR